MALNTETFSFMFVSCLYFMKYSFEIIYEGMPRLLDHYFSKIHDFMCAKKNKLRDFFLKIFKHKNIPPN